ncbi:MAG: hypothetical protein KA105_05705 [Caulobacter sp.]|nr:hypothetical protein [Caulobacter sp.]
MRSKLFAGAALAAVALALSAGPSFTRDSAVDPLAISAICSNEAAGSGGSTPAPTPAAAPPRMLAGYGNNAFAITTKNPEAQKWFDYGLTLARAFAHRPAKLAFAEAARLDPDCAMCAWGQAWADGPTINYPINATEKAAALKLAMKAQALAANGPEKERVLAAALVRRYAEGDKAFAEALRAAHRQWPDDDEIAVWTADAMMVALGWEFKPEAATPSVALLETVLERNPDHSGAIHFYIHATEWQEDQEKAVPYADRLALIAPAASHLIHMPSHTYFWVGRYQDAAKVNLQAIAADEAWIKATGWDKGEWKVDYFGHNVRFALGGALIAGDAASALKIAARYETSPDARAASPWAQSGVGAAQVAYGRYSDPDAVLALPAPPKDQPFVLAMHHYARGEALARKGDAKGARAEAAKIRPSGHKMLKVQMEIAREVLLGRAEMLEGDYRSAAKYFRKAADRQDKVLGTHGDPPVWWYPVRRSLAAALLADGKPNPAAEEARAVLKFWKNEPMTLLVLARAETALGREQAADAALAKGRAAWNGAALDKTAPATI